MTIFFLTKRLQKECSTKREAVRAHGQHCGRRLMQRMNELSAAATLADVATLPGPRCHELTGGRKGQLSVDLQHPYRLLFIPANDPVPRKPDGGLDWSKVTEIEIIEIADTH
jgi:plasmid maintenance system killer protein